MRKANLAILSLLCILLYWNGLPVFSAIPPQERAALIALYNSTDGDNWTDNSGWKKPPLASDGFALPGRENTWLGITCDPGNTTVQMINLSENNLNGTLPPELGNLPNLQDLALGLNQLSGNIPPELGNLTKLHFLSFYSNQLNGNIPPELGNLADLQWLTLAGNQLIGNIPPELGNLVNLQYIDLSYNQITSIPPELGNLANLQYLDLCDNQIISIPPELGNLTNLQYLMIISNQLSGSIPPELGNLANLQILYLSYNQFSGSIPPELGNLVNLHYFWLNSNRLSGSIPPELGNLVNLNYFWLNSNRLNGNIPSNLTNLKKLFENYGLNLCWNALYTNDNVLRAFLNKKQSDGDWESTQTIAPANVTATHASTHSIDISWTPIPYTADPGGYRVFYSTTPGGYYTYFGMTANKTESSLTVTGLNPGRLYYFVVKTRTNPHPDNQNTVDSEYSVEVSASTLKPNIFVSGAVTRGGKGLQGVTITLSNGPTTLTDSNGNYSVTVSNGWTGTVTPFRAGYIFSPPKRSYSHLKFDTPHQDFQGSPVNILILTSPNGGESWGLLTVQNITWISSGLSGNVNLQLWKSDKKVGDIAANIPIANGSYAWAVGICLTGVVPEGSGYKVKICTKDGLYFDFSNASFSIVH
jgi:Leucine-rich repeat (LRR) protein